MVEYRLAKARVAGSNPVSRLRNPLIFKGFFVALICAPFLNCYFTFFPSLFFRALFIMSSSFQVKKVYITNALMKYTFLRKCRIYTLVFGVHILLIYLFILFCMLSFYLKCVFIGICMESKDLFLLTNAN